MGMSLEKVSQQAPSLLSLAKSASESVLDAGLDGQVAKVALVLDYSMSMYNIYESGAMQRLTEKVLALATQLDDDGAIDFFVFDSSAAYLGEVNIKDFKGSVDRLTRNRSMGSTNYAQAFYTVRDHFGFAQPEPAEPKKGLFKSFRKVQPQPEAAPASEPVFAIFLTDGEPNSQNAAVSALTEVSTAPIFWKFISVGRNIPFLQKLDDLTDRFMDNADYQPVKDVDKVSDSELFKLLLVEYPEWLAEARSKGIIK